MSGVLGLFNWGNGNFTQKTTQQGQGSNELGWDDLPELVHLEIFKYLDKTSLTNLRQVSSSARYLIEYVHGLHVFLPARNWTFRNCIHSLLPNVLKSPKISILTDSMLRHLLDQMEGRKIITLTIREMPPLFTPPFERFIKYPNWVKEVYLEYVDVSLVHYVLSKCTKLTVFWFCSGHWRPLPGSGLMGYTLSGASYSPVPIPATNDKLLAAINDFPAPSPRDHKQLAQLKNLTLVVGQMTDAFSSDWGTVVYIMLGSPPALPCLTNFKFEFYPRRRRLSWKIHLLVLSCFGEFLSKMPNLQVLQYRSTFNNQGNSEREPHWLTMMQHLIRKLGSDRLKSVSTATTGPAPRLSFQTLVNRVIIASVAPSLTKLRELDVELGNSSEIDIFSDFIRHLQSPHLTTCRLSELFLRGQTPVQGEPIMHRLFLPTHEDNPDILPVYQSVTELTVSIDSQPQNGNAAAPNILFKKTLANLPQLTVLNLKQCPKNTWDKFLIGFVEILDPDTNVFSKLEKLSIENIIVQNLIPRMLIHCKNLKELNFKFTLAYGFANGIDSTLLLKLFASLRKLEKVFVEPFYFLHVTGRYLLNPNLRQHIMNSVKERNALQGVGELERCENNLPVNQILRLLVGEEVPEGKFRISINYNNNTKTK